MRNIMKRLVCVAIAVSANSPMVAHAANLTVNYGTTGASYTASGLFQIVEAGNPYNDTPRTAIYDEGGSLTDNGSAVPLSTSNYSIAAVFTTTAAGDFYAGVSSSVVGLPVGFDLFKGAVLITPGVATGTGASIAPIILSSGTYSLLVHGGFASHEAEGLLSFGGSPVAPVSEPATWAIMLAGFGVIGSAVRRRKQSIVSFA